MCHFGSLTCAVMLTGSDHVSPSSLLLANTNCPVESGERPGCDPAMDRSRLLHSAATQIVFVAGSKRMDGSPTRLFSWSGPMSRISFFGSHVFPPAVLRF